MQEISKNRLTTPSLFLLRDLRGGPGHPRFKIPKTNLLKIHNNGPKNARWRSLRVLTGGCCSPRMSGRSLVARNRSNKRSRSSFHMSICSFIRRNRSFHMRNCSYGTSPSSSKRSSSSVFSSASSVFQRPSCEITSDCDFQRSHGQSCFRTPTAFSLYGTSPSAVSPFRKTSSKS